MLNVTGHLLVLLILQHLLRTLFLQKCRCPTTLLHVLSLPKLHTIILKSSHGNLSPRISTRLLRHFHLRIPILQHNLGTLCS